MIAGGSSLGVCRVTVVIVGVIVLLAGAGDTAVGVVTGGGVGCVTLVLGIAVEESLSSHTVFRLPLRLLSRPLKTNITDAIIKFYFVFLKIGGRKTITLFLIF